MRRSGPRPLSAALRETMAQAAPHTLLARVQAVWPAVAGAAIAKDAGAVSERSGTVTFECESASWAQELTLLEPDLRTRLNAALGGGAEEPVKTLRFRVVGRG